MSLQPSLQRLSQPSSWWSSWPPSQPSSWPCEGASGRWLIRLPLQLRLRLQLPLQLQLRLQLPLPLPLQPQPQPQPQLQLQPQPQPQLRLRLRPWLALSLLLPLLLLSACATRLPAPAERDGPPAVLPPDLQQRPDAEPRVEPIRSGGANKPYEVLGRRYEPLTADVPLAQTGLASWYGRKFHGRKTASGEPYDMFAMSAAHKTMPIPSYARVRNPANGREVIVRINDRGPFVDGRIIDLSYTAALRLGVLGGIAAVEVRRLTHDDIRNAIAARLLAEP